MGARACSGAACCRAGCVCLPTWRILRRAFCAARLLPPQLKAVVVSLHQCGCRAPAAGGWCWCGTASPLGTRATASRCAPFPAALVGRLFARWNGRQTLQPACKAALRSRLIHTPTTAVLLLLSTLPCCYSSTRQGSSNFSVLTEKGMEQARAANKLVSEQAAQHGSWPASWEAECVHACNVRFPLFRPALAHPRAPFASPSWTAGSLTTCFASRPNVRRSSRCLISCRVALVRLCSWKAGSLTGCSTRRSSGRPRQPTLCGAGGRAPRNSWPASGRLTCTPSR